MTKTKKTPISYYGGKQSMLKHILPLIPEHKTYVEPFFGGGAVFWGKEKSEVEIINDYNGNVVNFYVQLKTNFQELKRLIDATPYSRETYKRAITIYDTPYIFETVKRAWAFWTCCIQGFNNNIGSWRGNASRIKESLLNHNKKLLLNKCYSDRLDLVQIEQKDAVCLIHQLDTFDAFFYIDPPYIGANQGHYGGYTQEYFNELLDALSEIKGKFLLSSYPNEQLERHKNKFNWVSSINDMHLITSSKRKKRKTEVLTSNYRLAVLE